MCRVDLQLLSKFLKTNFKKKVTLVENLRISTGQQSQKFKNTKISKEYPKSSMTHRVGPDECRTYYVRFHDVRRHDFLLQHAYKLKHKLKNLFSCFISSFIYATYVFSPSIKTWVYKKKKIFKKAKLKFVVGDPIYLSTSEDKENEKPSSRGRFGVEIHVRDKGDPLFYPRKSDSEYSINSCMKAD